MLITRLRADDVPAESCVQSIVQHPPMRVPGTAVFLHSRAGSVPPALLANLKHNHVLHERVTFLTIATEDIPRVHPTRRVAIQGLGAEFYQLTLHVGFMEDIDVPQALTNLVTEELGFNTSDTTYFLGRETLFVTTEAGMARWRKHLFVGMARNARGAALFFGLPPDRVIEVGVQIRL